jgi:Cu(I)/Ag(I) efflux system membrane fusion protein
MPNLGLSPTEVTEILQYVQLQKSHEASTTTSAPARRATASTGSIPSTSSPLVDAAIAIQSALAHDTMVGVVTQAMSLRQAAAGLGASGAAIEKAAADLAKQTTIADARTAFGAMSDALVASVRAGEVAIGDGVRIGYCPMVRKSWLQQDGPVANPYYGSRMLNCGELTK